MGCILIGHLYMCCSSIIVVCVYNQRKGMVTSSNSVVVPGIVSQSKERIGH